MPWAKCGSCGAEFEFSEGLRTTFSCQKFRCGSNTFTITGMAPIAIIDQVTKAEKAAHDISVVVTCHNMLGLTVRCIEHLRRSRYRPYEVILVDNGSTDGTKEWAEQQSDITYARQETNIGCAMGRNAGGRRATGKRILFLDNDQFVGVDTIGKLVAKANESYDAVGCDLWAIEPDGSPRHISDPGASKLWYVGTGGLLISAEVWARLGGNDERYAPAWYADTDLCFRMRQNGYRVGWLRDHNIYHVGSSTITAQTTFDANLAFDNSQKKFKERWAHCLRAGKIVPEKRRQLKICVVEWNISRISGRMSTMMRFADAFKRLGHVVKVHSNFYAEEIRDPRLLLPYHDAKHLTMDDLQLDLGAKYGSPADLWKGQDVVIVTWPYAYIADLPGMTKTIIWYIAKRTNPPRRLFEYWTNTRTKAMELHAHRWIFPPYDYSAFRRAARPFEEREFDICYAARTNTPEKRIEEFIRVAKHMGLKATVCAIGLSPQLESSGITYKYDQPKAKVAEMMGNSKVYFHPSVDESASIAIYEALNAGCWPVVFRVGAIAEQLGKFGDTYFDHPEELITEALKTQYDISDLQEWGMRYDIEQNIDRLDLMLQDVATRL